MRFTVSGVPLPKARHRYYLCKGRVMIYDPQEGSKKYVRMDLTKQLRLALDSVDKTLHMQASELTRGNHFSVTLEFHLPIADSNSDPERNLKLWGILPATSKPDCDNLEKFILDCANGVLFPDDRQITQLKSCKKYSKTPKTVIDIMALKPPHISQNKIDVFKIFSPEKFIDLVHSAKKLSCIDLESLGDSDEVWLEKAAGTVVEFAEKYARDLAKIQKRCKPLVEDVLENPTKESPCLFSEEDDGRAWCGTSRDADDFEFEAFGVNINDNGDIADPF